MLKLLKWALLAAGLAAVAAFVPVHGRTVLDRWHSAGGAGAFAGNAWHELKQVWEIRTEKPAARRAAAPPHRSGTRSPASVRISPPVEDHTEADRKALDRILEHASGR